MLQICPPKQYLNIGTHVKQGRHYISSKGPMRGAADLADERAHARDKPSREQRDEGLPKPLSWAPEGNQVGTGG